MDTSKKYILMCEKATEIQSLCKSFTAIHIIDGSKQLMLNQYGDFLTNLFISSLNTLWCWSLTISSAGFNTKLLEADCFNFFKKAP